MPEISNVRHAAPYLLPAAQKASAPILNQFWELRPKQEGYQGGVVNLYFQHLMKEEPSSDMAGIEKWVHDLLLAVEDGHHDQLYSMLDQGTLLSSMRKWLSYISSQPFEFKKDDYKHTINELLKNVGFQNTFALLCGCYQLARQITEEKEDGWEGAEACQSSLAALINQLEASYPEKYRQIDRSNLAFNKKAVPLQFLMHLDHAPAKDLLRQRLIQGVVLAVLGTIGSYAIMRGTRYLASEDDEAKYRFYSSKFNKVPPEVQKIIIDQSLARSDCRTHTGISCSLIDEAFATNLHHLKVMSPFERLDAIKKFALESIVEERGAEDFNRFLNEMDIPILESINLWGLKRGLKYALLNDDQFKHLKISDFDVRLSSLESDVLLTRLQQIKKDPAARQAPGELLSLPVVHFFQLKAQQINLFIPKLPPALFALLSDEQIVGLDLSKLSSEQAGMLFAAQNLPRDKKLFARWPIEGVHAILDLMNEYQCTLISDQQLKQLGATRINEELLNKLFSPNTLTFDEHKKRFAVLTPQLVQAVFEKLHKHQMSLISDEQLKQLDFSKFSETSSNTLFALHVLPFMEQKRRFALLSKQQLQAVFDNLNEEQMALISDEQLKLLDPTKFTNELIKKLLSMKIVRAEEQRRRVALFSKEQVHAMFPLMEDSHKILLSPEQLKAMKP
jgi:hypothetical protein